MGVGRLLGSRKKVGSSWQDSDGCCMIFWYFSRGRNGYSKDSSVADVGFEMPWMLGSFCTQRNNSHKILASLGDRCQQQKNT